MADSATWTDAQALRYIASYTDLRTALGADAEKGREHYARFGEAEGRTIRFDALAYTASYGDLIATFRSDEAASARHYIRYGVAEGRWISFDALRYLASYGDLLVAFGTDASAATRHFIDNGFREGRSASFDAVGYLLSYPDLGAAQLGASQALNHWIANGFSEKRAGDALYGREQANHALTVGNAESGTIDSSTDRDWYAIELGTGQTVRFDIDFAQSGKARLDIFDQGGVRLNQLSGNDGTLPFTATASGTYYLSVAGSQAGSFALTTQTLAPTDGSGAGDRMTGSDAAESLRGLAGNDILFGNNGSDILEGAAGDDFLFGGLGGDVLFGDVAGQAGGTGNDVLVDLPTLNRSVNSVTSDDSLYGQGGDDLLEVRRAFTPDSNVIMDGGSGNDAMIFQDEYRGGPLRTLVMRGGAGNDRIFVTNRSTSEIDAGTGDDQIRIDMRNGTHQLRLGAGADTVTLYRENAPVAMSASIVVDDFQVGQDKIDMTFFLAGTLTGWNMNQNVFAAGYLRLVQDGADARLDMDSSGSGASFRPLIVFRNVDADRLTAAELGHDPAGIAHGLEYRGFVYEFAPGRPSPSGPSEWLLGADTHSRIDGGGGYDLIEGGTGKNILLGGAFSSSNVIIGNVDDDMMFGTIIGPAQQTYDPGEEIFNPNLLADSWGGNDQLYGSGAEDILYVARKGNMAPSTILMDGSFGSDKIIFDAQHRYLDIVTIKGANDLVYVGSALRADIIMGNAAETVIIDPRTRYTTIALGGGADRLVLQRTFEAFKPATLISISDVSRDDKIYVRDYLADVLIGWDGTTDPFSAGYLTLNDGLFIDPDGPGEPMTAQLLISGALVQTQFDVANVSLGTVDQGEIGNWSARGVFSAIEDSVSGVVVGNIINHALRGEPLTISADQPLIVGTGRADDLIGTGADELLTGLTNADRMTGSDGNDSYHVLDVDDVVVETAAGGVDTVLTALTTYKLPDHVENLEVTPFGQRGTIVRASGNALNNEIRISQVILDDIGLLRHDSIIDGGQGADVMQGSYGNDIYYVDDIGDVVLEYDEGGDFAGIDMVITSLPVYQIPLHVENLTGLSNAGQELIGDSGNNHLTGGDGNDILRGRGGSDRIDGGAGADLMVGGSSNDIFVIDNVDDVIEDSGGSDDGIITDLLVWTLSSGIENLTGTNAAGQYLTGNASDNEISGGAGNDSVFGLDGSDRLSGLDGADRLDGGAGRDSLSGGNGADMFLFTSALGTQNIDVIADFILADDSMGLSASIFTNAGSIGDLSPAAFRIGPSATTADHRILYNPLNGYVYYDADGNGSIAPVLFATLTNRVNLTADDFQIIG